MANFAGPTDDLRRGIATRYAKNAAAYLAAVHIRCLALWFDIS